jgi:hypothetical protein
MHSELTAVQARLLRGYEYEAQVLYDYSADPPGTLAVDLYRGEIVQITQDDPSSNWLKGRLRGSLEEGSIPRTYVRRLNGPSF